MELVNNHEQRLAPDSRYTVTVNENKVQILLKEDTNEMLYVIDESTKQVDIVVKEGIKAECVLRLEPMEQLEHIHILVERDATLVQHFVHVDSNKESNIQVYVDVQENAKFEGMVIEFASNNVKCKVDVHLNEIAATSYVRLATVASHKEKKQFDIITTSHARQTSGVMDNYGVVKDQGDLLIIGTGRMNKGVSGSTSEQTNRVIMFDKESKADTKPNLYIDEFDVKASHACSVGTIDENQLYYLCSRGLTEAHARRFITLGYLIPVLDYVSNEEIKKEIQEVILKKVN